MSCRVDKSTDTGDLVACDRCGYVAGPFTNAGQAAEAARSHRRVHVRVQTPRR
ncbi:MAG: hypothetical protein PIR02_11840 [Microbacterium enclense]